MLFCYSAFQALTLDVIGQCAFALKVHCQTDPNDPFLVHCSEYFRLADIQKSTLLTLAGTILELASLM